MDEFGVLVESIGFKSQRNSAPMAHLKSKPKTDFSFNNGFPDISSANASRSSFYDNNHNNSFVDDLDGIFQSNRNNYSSSKKSQNFFDGGDNIFDGGSLFNSKPQKGIIDFDSTIDLKNSNSKSSSDFYGDDLLTSGPRKGDALDVFFGNLKVGGKEKGSQYDDLIPGFEGTGPSTSRSNDSGNTRMASEPKVSQPSSGHSSKSSSSADDPFLVFESSRSEENASSWPFSDLLEQNAGKSSVESSLDEFEKFARGMPPGDEHDKPSREAVRNITISLKKKDDKARDNARGRDVNTDAKIVHEKQRGKEKNRVDKVTNNKKESVGIDIFGMDTLSNVNGPRSQLKDPVLDALFNEKREPEVKDMSIRGSSRTSKDFDGLSSLFEGPEFQEIEGETEERRSRRLNQHIKMQDRMIKAVEEKQQRDLEAQYEQEERRRLADSLDNDIKRWSAGKENNLRALLSSLQDVIWPESGWQPVSLADLITSTSVIRVYKKASMCFHPDKVQQRGCNLQQKYVAEKVFDVLKEARSNFNELQ